MNVVQFNFTELEFGSFRIFVFQLIFLAHKDLSNYIVNCS